MPYPYTVTTSGLVAVLRQLRSAFPTQVTADTLRKWQIASNNESTVLAVLRFLGILDEEGRKQAGAADVFVEHDDRKFAESFEALVRAAYADLFATWSEEAWKLDRSQLIRFFRTADKTSATVGERQAKTFETLAGLVRNEEPSAGVPARRGAGKGGVAVRKSPSKQPLQVVQPIDRLSRSSVVKQPSTDVLHGNGAPAVTVRIEINLPVTDDQEVYDKIFKSLRSNLY